MNVEPRQTQIDVIAELRIRAKNFHLGGFLNNNVAQTIERLKEKGENGMTALHLAARDIPDTVVIRCLIVLGADVNAKDNRGMSHFIGRPAAIRMSMS